MSEKRNGGMPIVDKDIRFFRNPYFGFLANPLSKGIVIEILVFMKKLRLIFPKFLSSLRFICLIMFFTFRPIVAFVPIRPLDNLQFGEIVRYFSVGRVDLRHCLEDNRKVQNIGNHFLRVIVDCHGSFVFNVFILAIKAEPQIS